MVGKIVDGNKIKELIIKQNDESKQSGIRNQKEILNKELQKTEDEIKTLYTDYRNGLLDEDDYKQFYGEIANKKNRIKKEIEIIEKQEESTPVLNEDKLKSVVNEIKNMKGIRKDIVSDIIYNIENNNQK